MSRVEEKYIKMYIFEKIFQIAIYANPNCFKVGCHLVILFSNNLQEMWQSSDFTHISKIYHEYPNLKKSTFNICFGYNIYIWTFCFI